ncbi:MAG: ArsA family ATPase [Acidimicrobiales bacterium]
MSLVEHLADKRVTLCLGSGGVGKTTGAAALAIAMAAQGSRVVVLTIDPARRLADALGQGGSLGTEPLRVKLPKSIKGRGQVWAAMLDPEETFEQIIRSEATDEDQAERILNNRLFKNLVTSLSGTNEYMAAERLHQLHHDPRFDQVIIDTPPSRHAFDFLDSPGRMTRFIDHRLYRSVFASKPRLLRPLNAGSQIIMRLLAKLVGSSLVDDVVAFFSDFEGLDSGFRRRADEIEGLLTGPEAGYLLVTAPRLDRLREARWILDNLSRRERQLDAIVVNRMMPIDIEAAESAIAALEDRLEDPSEADESLQNESLRQNLSELTSMAEQETQLIAGLRAEAAEQLGQAENTIVVTELAEQQQPVSDIQGLAGLAELLNL